MAVASLFEDLLDQYKIEEHIAEKHYTNQYRAFDVDDNRPARLDILRPEYASSNAFCGRFINRARALAQVRHPNIAQILHLGSDDSGVPYVAQEAIDGTPLSARQQQFDRRNRPVNPIYALKLVRQLADALLLAEKLDLVHYELQPQHILLRNVALPSDDTVVLLDLFIPSRTRPRQHPAEFDPNWIDYISPEQRSGREISPRSHIYSLGVILYRLLAGHLPRGPVMFPEVALDRIVRHSTSLERARGGLSPSTYRLIDRCLRKDPRRRYPDIASFTAALDEALTADEVRSRDASTAGDPRERRSLAWMLPILILLLFLTVGAVATQGIRSRVMAPNAITISPVALLMAGETATSSPEEDRRATLAGNPEPRAVAVQATELPEEATAPSGLGATPTPVPTGTEVKAATDAPTPAAVIESQRFARVMLNMVNLRHGPGIDYDLFGNLIAGDILEVIAWNMDPFNPWLLVMTEDRRIGWISSKLVQLENDLVLSAIPAAATLPPAPVTMTATSTPAATPTIFVTTVTPELTVDPAETGEPPPAPTNEPQEPTMEPSRTPEPLETPSP